MTVTNKEYYSLLNIPIVFTLLMEVCTNLLEDVETDIYLHHDNPQVCYKIDRPSDCYSLKRNKQTSHNCIRYYNYGVCTFFINYALNVPYLLYPSKAEPTSSSSIS